MNRKNVARKLIRNSNEKILVNGTSLKLGYDRVYKPKQVLVYHSMYYTVICACSVNLDTRYDVSIRGFTKWESQTHAPCEFRICCYVGKYLKKQMMCDLLKLLSVYLFLYL